MELNLTILKEVYGKTARKMEQILQTQAPKLTGKLRNSIRVDYSITDKQGSVSFTITLNGAPYGWYLQTGTGEERDNNPSNKKWNPNPAKGIGGIEPRYWMNFSDVEKQVFLNDVKKIQIKARKEIIKKEFINFKV